MPRMLFEGEDPSVVGPDPLEHPIAVEESMVKNRHTRFFLAHKRAIDVNDHALVSCGLRAGFYVAALRDASESGGSPELKERSRRRRRSVFVAAAVHGPVDNARTVVEIAGAGHPRAVETRVHAGRPGREAVIPRGRVH